MIHWKNAVLAGVGGLACAKAVTVAQNHPDTAKLLLSYSAASSLVGVALGVSLAAYRKTSLFIYGFSAGANFAVCSLTFFGVRHAIVEGVPQTIGSEDVGRASLKSSSPWRREYLGSIVSGGVTGSLASTLSRHSAKVTMGTGLGGVVVGLVGQWTYFRFNHWRKKQAVLQQNPHLAPKKGEKWTFQSFEAWFLGFWHKRSEVSKVESEITVLEHDVEVERSRIEELDKLLGVPQPAAQLTSDTTKHTENDYPHSQSLT